MWILTYVLGRLTNVVRAKRKKTERKKNIKSIYIYIYIKIKLNRPTRNNGEKQEYRWMCGRGGRLRKPESKERIKKKIIIINKGDEVRVGEEGHERRFMALNVNMING